MSAYIYSKSSRGNLPSETLAKLLSVAHKLSLVTPILVGSPLARALDAAKTALIQANRSWLAMGPRALGPLGEIGSASTPDAVAAWTKATDGKVRSFDSGTGANYAGPAIDAGRLVGPRRGEAEAPPQYEPPPAEEVVREEANEAAAERVVEQVQEAAHAQDTEGVRAAVTEAVTNGGGAEPRSEKAPQSELDLEQGRARLAQLRQALLERQQAEEGATSQGSQRPVDSDVLEAENGRTPPPPGHA